MRIQIAFFVVVVAVLLSASAAQARKSGNTYSLAANCSGCHAQGTEPTLVLTQVTPDPLTAGGSAIFNVQLTSTQGAGAGRFAAFAASVESAAGTFVAGDVPGAETEACPIGSACPANKTAIRDVTRRAFDAGSFDWDIELTNLGAGSFTLRAGGNDVNGNGSTGGDNNVAATLAFTVGEGEGEGEGEVPAEGEGEGEVPAEGEGEGEVPAEGEGEGEPAEGEGEGEGETGGGCFGAASQASAAGFGLALLALRRRRR